MSGTVIITGANGSVALGFVDHLLSSYPAYTLLATVRNTSDVNSAKLSDIIASKPNAKAQIETLDLSSLEDVRSFAEKIAERVASGELPRIKAIVCNAFTWSLSETKYTQDGLEASFQVGHLSHYLLILKLLGSIASDGRIVLLGSNTHYPDRPHPLTKLTAQIPDDVEQMVRPLPDEPGQEHDRGFQRYGISKLANVLLMHDLNTRLKKACYYSPLPLPWKSNIRRTQTFRASQSQPWTQAALSTPAPTQSKSLPSVSSSAPSHISSPLQST